MSGWIGGVSVSSDGFILGGQSAVLQAPLFDSFVFDPFALFNDGLCFAELGLGRRDIVQAFMMALLVIALDERLDLAFKITGQEVVFQEDVVFEGLVPAFDLALCLGMERGTAYMAQSSVLRYNQPGRQRCSWDRCLTADEACAARWRYHNLTLLTPYPAYP